MPPGTPLMACTATATRSIHQEVVLSLEITNCVKVSHSPDRPNIFYEVQPRSDIDTDFSDLLSTLREMLNKTLHCENALVKLTNHWLPQFHLLFNLL